MIIKSGGVAIAASKTCELTILTDTDPVASPSDGKWKRYIIGRSSWKVTTGHLVTSVVRSAQMSGALIHLEMGLRDNIGLPFAGFVSGVTTASSAYQGLVTSDSIFWDKTLKAFVASVTLQHASTQYYTEWTGSSAYSSPSDYDLFSIDNTGTYLWYDGDLSAEKMTGSAIVTTWKGTFSRGNLAQGSFEFLGNGPITPASLPSTE